MNLYVNGYNIFLIILVTFVTSLILTPLAKKIAFHVGAVDVPDNKRKVHTETKARLGGLAIFFSFLVGYMLFANKSPQMLSVLMGGFVILVLGFVDDIKPLTAMQQFIGQLIAAAIIVFYGNITFDDMKIFGMYIQFGMFAYPLSILFIVSIINAINLADGLDGLAAGTSTIYFITIGIIAYIMNKLGGLDVILCLIMIGACLGFLIYNFAPASIFMGDIGSNFLGFIISVIALLGFKTATITSLIIPLLTLFVPIIDTVMAIGRRLIKGKSIGSSDREHLHHQLLKRTKSTTKTVLIMYFINILFAVVSILYTLGDKKSSMILYLVLLILFIVLTLKTDILFEHTKINLYDFDKTIYDGDSSVDFFLFNLRKNPLLILNGFKMIYAIIIYKLGIIDKTKMKVILFSYLKRVKDVDKKVEEFWKTHKKKIKAFYMLKKHDKDVIISASPEFLLEPMVDYLKIKKLIGSKVNKHTGEFDGLNCHDEEKVRRLNEVYKDYEVLESYSDSKADIPILKLAKKAYYVKGNKLIETKF